MHAHKEGIIAWCYHQNALQLLHSWSHETIVLFPVILSLLSIGLIKQFLKDVDWGEVDYLLVDTPPGTSDEHLSVVQYLSTSGIDGAIVITTPQVGLWNFQNYKFGTSFFL